MTIGQASLPVRGSARTDGSDSSTVAGPPTDVTESLQSPEPEGQRGRALPRVASGLSALERLSAGLWSRLAGTSTLLKQSPVALLAGIAIVLSLTDRSATVNAPGLLTGVAVVALATALSAVFTLRPDLARYENLIVVLDFAATEILRSATGGSRSIIGALVIVPTIWTARMPGRRHIAYAAAGVAVVFLIPTVSETTRQGDPSGVARGCLNILVYSVAATIINELSRQARVQFDVVRAREQAFGQELDRGAEVQQALLPKGASPVPGYDVAGRCVPAKVVGGDFYDWYPIPGGLGFTLGDVMGKGVGAGMIAATAHAVVRSARFDNDPVSALLRTDACLSTELGDVGSFTTMFHARLRTEDGLVEYADAGHGLTLHVRADGSWQRLSATDLPLGLGVNARWEARELVLDEGDMLVCFSDGVLELYDGTLAAADHVGALAASCSTANELVDRISHLAIRTSNPDDVTVLVVRRERSAPPRS